ncbi:MAG: DUF4136 domain-containing protein [Acidobacteria bacterium]|nr:DUF4136 domain-containing protein [Acidobacteriota bacterium]
MKPTKYFLLLQALVVLVAGAYGQDVHYNFDRGTNFASFKTYQWVGVPGRVQNQFIDRDIKRSVDEQLAQKGLTRVERDADLYVGYQAAVDLEKGVDLWSKGFGGFEGPRDRTVQGRTSTMAVGTLLVNLYDPAKKQLIWRGDASNTIDLKKDPDKNYKTLQKAMAKLFKNYPPRAAK